MRRLVVILALAACEPNRSPVVTSDIVLVADAAVDAEIDAFVEIGLASRLEKLEPTGRPPKPLLRRHRVGDCSTRYAPRPDRDPNPMCRIRGGTFRMGGVLENPSQHIVSSHSPPTKITVHDFDIDQFEVTAPQVARFLNAHGNECPGLHRKFLSICVELGYVSGIEVRDRKYSVVPGYEQVVVDYFSYEGAMRYCAWVGKQVASSAQWEYAARHDPSTGRDLLYPWGNEWRPKHSCALREDCPDEWKRFGTMWRAGLFDGTRGRADGSSPHGVHDMVVAGDELVFECDSPDETCRAGTSCGCRARSTVAVLENDELVPTYARLRETFYGAVRCVVPR